MTQERPTPIQTMTFAQVNPYGVNTFLADDVEPWKREKTMEMIAAAGIGWIKQGFLWSEIEPARGSHWDQKWQQDAWKKYDEIVALAERYGVRIIARLDHTPESGPSPRHDAEYSALGPRGLRQLRRGLRRALPRPGPVHPDLERAQPGGRMGRQG